MSLCVIMGSVLILSLCVISWLIDGKVVLMSLIFILINVVSILLIFLWCVSLIVLILKYIVDL